LQKFKQDEKRLVDRILQTEEKIESFLPCLQVKRSDWGTIGIWSKEGSQGGWDKVDLVEGEIKQDWGWDHNLEPWKNIRSGPINPISSLRLAYSPEFDLNAVWICRSFDLATGGRLQFGEEIDEVFENSRNW